MKRVIFKSVKGEILFSLDSTGGFTSSIEKAMSVYLKEEPNPAKRPDRLTAVHAVEMIKV